MKRCCGVEIVNTWCDYNDDGAAAGDQEIGVLHARAWSALGALRAKYYHFGCLVFQRAVTGRSVGR